MSVCNFVQVRSRQLRAADGCSEPRRLAEDAEPMQDCDVREVRR
jgi:hypothetical protein